jgi:hypothetical protein
VDWRAIVRRVFPWVPPEVRLGHALLGTDDHDVAPLITALDVIGGKIDLEPRSPRDPDAVLTAEDTFGGARPIYAFLGLLHPELGTVGIVVSPRWATRCLVGASRCDSGGLFGGRGGFACIIDAAASWKTLSYKGARLSSYKLDFRKEMISSYTDAETDYVRGVVPDCTGWNDDRVACIEYLRGRGAMPDRRLWTWETRLQGSPVPREVECLVVSPEMHKRLEALRHTGVPVPASVRVLTGSVGSMGVHWFDMASVHSAFLGIR